MSLAEVDSTTADVRVSLVGIASELPQSVHACVFNLVHDDQLNTDVALVVMILAYDEWDAAAEQACEEASDLAWSALSSLGIIADVICRTQVEHDAVRDGEQWLALDDNC